MLITLDHEEMQAAIATAVRDKVKDQTVMADDVTFEVIDNKGKVIDIESISASVNI